MGGDPGGPTNLIPPPPAHQGAGVTDLEKRFGRDHWIEKWGKDHQCGFFMWEAPRRSKFKNTTSRLCIVGAETGAESFSGEGDIPNDKNKDFNGWLLSAESTRAKKNTPESQKKTTARSQWRNLEEKETPCSENMAKMPFLHF